MSQKNSLFFIRADNCDGENQDLLVIASDAVQAEKFWYDYYELEDEVEEKPLWVRGVPGVVPTAEAGPIAWNDIHPTDDAKPA